MIPRTVLIAVEPFGEGLSAERAGAAIGRGLQTGDPSLGVDLCPIEPTVPEDFDARMRAARAIVVGAERLDERTLLGSATFEIATRARQAGVPAYAVTAENDLSLFDARILDLQVILQAQDTRALRSAGEKLAVLV
jgi:glycerate kinase